MSCSDPRKTEEEQAREALETLDSYDKDKLSVAVKILESLAKKKPRQRRSRKVIDEPSLLPENQKTKK